MPRTRVIVLGGGSILGSAFWGKYHVGISHFKDITAE